MLTKTQNAINLHKQLQPGSEHKSQILFGIKNLLVHCSKRLLISTHADFLDIFFLPEMRIRAQVHYI